MGKYLFHGYEISVSPKQTESNEWFADIAIYKKVGEKLAHKMYYAIKSTRSDNKYECARLAFDFGQNLIENEPELLPR